ncbi:multidrug effflux MFS transporter [Demequina sp. NBRC 110056]|uniref:multidrug effflux MFS transporter n=1 Tax=Demequina sp. NBRC 110056 TaxID=1570345 RepID=UPI001F32C681|nr:multidrug effflux MFS transporter [Demequina sp. NBRC 110056]
MLTAVTLGMLTVFGPLSMDLYLPVLPSLASDLASTASAAQLTMTACLVGLAAGQVIAGPLSDRYGRRRPVLSGLLVYTLASALCAVSVSMEMLIGMRLAQGLAGGVGLVVAQTVGRDLYEGARLTRYYARIVVISGLAAIVAPVLGGFLADVVSWRGFFVILTGVGVVATLVVLFWLPETLAHDARVSGGLRRTASQLAILARDRLYVGATVSSSLTAAAYFVYLAGAPFVLQEMHGLSPSSYALVFGVNAAAFAAAGFGAGRATERWGDRAVYVVGLAVLVLAGGVLLACALWVDALAPTVVAFVLVAAGAAIVSPPATTLALVGYPHFAGTASSILGMSRFAAGAAAAPLAGILGPTTMLPLATTVLVAAVLASAVYRIWLAERRATAQALDPEGAT